MYTIMSYLDKWKCYDGCDKFCAIFTKHRIVHIKHMVTKTHRVCVPTFMVGINPFIILGYRIKYQKDKVFMYKVCVTILQLSFDNIAKHLCNYIFIF